MKTIISLATYPKRLEKLKKVIPTLIQQTLQVDEIIVNIPDNLMKVEYQQYDQLQKEFPQISVKRRDGRWRSANKYIWTYKDNPDAVIMTCDDDILYESTRFEELYNEWQINPNCIICHEINPMLIVDGKVKILNSIDIKLKQHEFGKYLTGCCLFPPHCMDGTDLYNFEKFFKMTHACHDEIWFWILTTLKGIQCIGLNCTYSFDLDGAAMPAEDTALCHINGKQENILKYEDLINTEYGKQLVEKMTSIPCQFEVTKDNLLSYIGNMAWLNSIYKSFCMQFIVKGLPKSSMMYFARAVNQFKWNRIQVLQANK